MRQVSLPSVLIHMIKKRFNQLKTLSLLEWQLLVTSAILLPLTALGLHLFGLKRTQQFMKYFTPAAPKTSPRKEEELRYGQMVARMASIAANHSIYRANCLKKSLVICWLLQRHGITADLRIGVKNEDRVLNAHSWVEIDGNVLIDDEHTLQNFCTMI